VEARVLPRAPERTAAELRRDVRRAVAAVDPRDAQAKHEDAAAERRVAYQPDEHGMAWLSAYLPAPDAQTVWLAVQAVADRSAALAAAANRAAHCAAHRAVDGAARERCGPACAGGEDGTEEAAGDERSADQRRADALTAICAAVLTGQQPAQLAALPAWQGRRPAVQVTVAMSTLLGVDEQPADLDGYGPIPAAPARRIAADPTGTWRRLVTDPTGTLRDYGRTRYRPPRDLAEHVIARDRTCRHPGCHRAARRAELDHITGWAAGGPTSATNLHALCPRHHRAKHEAGWRVHRHPDGSTHWTSPTGRRYRKPPDPLPIDRYQKPPDPFPIDHTRPTIPDDPPF
jgi:hypothetical protein